MNDYVAPVPSGGQQFPVVTDARSIAPYMPQLATDVDAQESVLRQYWRILFKRRYGILAITALCMGLALLMAMLTQRQYMASVRVQVEREASKVLEAGNVESGASATNFFSQEFYQTQYALLTSRSLSEAVVRDLRLADNYDFLSNYRPDGVGELRAMQRARRFQIATGIVNGNTIVSPVRMSSIIDVKYNSPSPAMAAAIANSIAEKFIEENLNRRFEATAYARQFLENRLNSVRAKLEDSERKAAAYAQAQGLIKISPGGMSGGRPDGSISSEDTLASQDLSQLSSQLAAAQNARVQAESEFRNASGGQAAAAGLTNPAVNALRQQRSELTAQLSKLQSDFGPDYPQVIALKAQLGELDRQLDREQSRVTSSVASTIGGRYRSAVAAESGLRARVNALKNNVLDQQQRTIQYNIIQRDVDTNRALYDSLLQRFKEIGVAGGIGTNNISIVDRALAPGSPSKPNLRLNLLIGLLAGLILGVGAALILEQLAEAAVLPADFQRKLGVSLLGATPKIDSGSMDRAMVDSKSPLSEAYFSVLTSIQFSTSHGTPKSMLLTSTQPREGKSTTALALGLGLASVGAKVLLIDADMRNPGLHRVLGKSLGAGLSSLLTGDGRLEDYIEPSGTTNLSFLVAGPMPPNPAELLSSDNVARIIRRATELFDHVIVDGPPILGLADAPLLSTVTEGVIFVVESGRTRATQARMAIERILAVRGHFIGAVLSKFDEKNSGYGYGYGYDYKYGK
ncbi:MAG: polysaccharide biosynthesis tyrosine autokinase [Sphingomicrobium sp.]